MLRQHLRFIHCLTACIQLYLYIDSLHHKQQYIYNSFLCIEPICYIFSVYFCVYTDIYLFFIMYIAHKQQIGDCDERFDEKRRAGKKSAAVR